MRGVSIVTNKDRINLLLKDNDKLVNFLNEFPCKHCYYYEDSSCIDPEVDDDMEALCVDGIKKWLESEDNKND